MAPPSMPPDELHSYLNELRLPETSGTSAQRIIAHARQNPRPVWKWLSLLRQLRAGLYLPQMRYVVMASMVGMFILIGLLGPSPKAPAMRIADDQLLQDITFDEEDPLKGFWTAGL